MGTKKIDFEELLELGYSYSVEPIKNQYGSISKRIKIYKNGNLVFPCKEGFKLKTCFYEEVLGNTKFDCEE